MKKIIIDRTKPQSGDFPSTVSWRERVIPMAGVFTMNATKEMVEKFYKPMFDSLGSYCRNAIGNYEAIYSYETKQFNDYSRYDVDFFSAEEKTKTT